VLRFFWRNPVAQHESAGAPHDFGAAVRELWRLPGFAAMLAVFAAVGIANWLVYTWLPLYLYERFRMSLA